MGAQALSWPFEEAPNSGRFNAFPIRSRRLRQKLFQEQMFAKKAATSTDVLGSAPPTGA
jgi:hypothetical protein